MLEIKSDQAIYSFAPDAQAVATIKSGAAASFVTRDCFSNQINSPEQLFESTDWSSINPATGPLAIEGAEPGDVLAVDILDIETADYGVMTAVKDMGAIPGLLDGSETRIIPIKNGWARFNENLSFPVNPMVGVIGTAPREETVPCGTPGAHGGNMDNKDIIKGARLYLPVWQKGGLLALGDLHALQGDGEVLFCGIEVAGRVTVRVNVIKGQELATPVLENRDYFYIIGSAGDLDEAAKVVMDWTHQFLKARLPLSNNEVAMLMSIVCDLQICQIVDPLITCRMAIPKKAFSSYQLSFAD